MAPERQQQKGRQQGARASKVQRDSTACAAGVLHDYRFGVPMSMSSLNPHMGMTGSAGMHSMAVVVAPFGYCLPQSMSMGPGGAQQAQGPMGAHLSMLHSGMPPPGMPALPLMPPPGMAPLPSMPPPGMMSLTMAPSQQRYLQPAPPPQAPPPLHHALSSRPNLCAASAAALSPKVSASVSSADVLSGVESLYRDELKPYGRILRKRIGEQALATGRGAVDVGIKELRVACEGCPWLLVQSEEGADWSAQIRGRPANFVDVYSPQDSYPTELWRAAAVYFRGLDKSNMVLPGGRYACAQVLVSRSLPFLAGRSLGQVCHIVQLAISQKKLLGYLNGTMVPYAHSQSMVKETCAERQRPCTKGNRGKTAIATWEMVPKLLREIIENMGPNEEFFPLSNIKRCFRARFQIELSETALGYAKLSELVQDPRLHDLCSVRLHGHGYVLVPVRQAVKRSPISLADTLLLDSQMSPASPPPRTSLQSRVGWIKPLCMEDIVADEASVDLIRAAPPQARVASACLAPAKAQDLACPVPATPMMTPFPATPSPYAARVGEASLLPRLLGSRTGRSLSQHGGEVSKGYPRMPAVPSPRLSPAKHAQHRMELAQADAAAVEVLRRTPAHQKAQEQALFPWRPAPLTPCTLGNMGLSVHNTFLHAALPPPTPIQGGASAGVAHTRARSLPRDLAGPY